MGRPASLLVLLAACYRAEPPPGLPCTTGHRCPSGLLCDELTDSCEETIPPAAVFASIAAGTTHTCAIDAAGALWCWGSNAAGELGLSDLGERLVPARVGTDSDWTAIAAGTAATCGLRGDTLWCWGDSQITGLAISAAAPTQIAGAWRAVSVGYDEACAVDSNGGVLCHERTGVAGFGATALGFNAISV